MRKAAIGAAALAAVAASSVSMAGITGNVYTVYVYNFSFSQNDPAIPGGSLPDDPTINVGDTVRWVLVDGRHNVTSVSGQLESFASPTSFTPGTVLLTHTFTNLGDFAYYCSIHGAEHDGMAMGMAGMVHVVPTPTGAALAAVGGLAAVRRRR